MRKSIKTFNFENHPHKRYNILTGEWVLVSPHRAKRPWQGQVEKATKTFRPKYDKNCYLCPGNVRANGVKNPNYENTFVFENDFSALKFDVPVGEINKADLLIAKSETGICRVICYSPRHDLTLSQMEVAAIRQVVDVWEDEYHSLGSNPNINYVLIFENKGEIMGCSNPHPHGQIWAQKTIPVEPAKEMRQMQAYSRAHDTVLLADYLKLELQEKERLVIQNDHFVALVPFWAIWPFETMVINKRAVSSLIDMTGDEKDALADILKHLTIKYDNLFNISFPYSAGIHQAPTDALPHPEWHFHIHFYPPLLRSAEIKKFMVGYEMLGNPQRDITPELSAGRLRELSGTMG